MLRPVMLVDILAVLALFPELRGLRALRLLRLIEARPELAQQFIHGRKEAI